MKISIHHDSSTHQPLIKWNLNEFNNNNLSKEMTKRVTCPYKEIM